MAKPLKFFFFFFSIYNGIILIMFNFLSINSFFSKQEYFGLDQTESILHTKQEGHDGPVSLHWLILQNLFKT